MIQLVSRNTRTRATPPPSSLQELGSRTARRSREDGVAATLREAKGRGGPVDPVPEQAMLSSLKAKDRWRKQVDDAGAAWSLLTESDLQALEDHEYTLAELIQERYGVASREADRQVMTFIEDHLSSSL